MTAAPTSTARSGLALTEVGLSLDLGVRWQSFLLAHLLGDGTPGAGRMADLILDRFAADLRLGLVFPEGAGEPLLSPKDTSAPTLAEAAVAGLLPTWDDMRAYYASLDAAHAAGEGE